MATYSNLLLSVLLAWLHHHLVRVHHDWLSIGTNHLLHHGLTIHVDHVWVHLLLLHHLLLLLLLHGSLLLHLLLVHVVWLHLLLAIHVDLIGTGCGFRGRGLTYWLSLLLLERLLWRFFSSGRLLLLGRGALLSGIVLRHFCWRLLVAHI